MPLPILLIITLLLPPTVLVAAPATGVDTLIETGREQQARGALPQALEAFEQAARQAREHGQERRALVAEALAINTRLQQGDNGVAPADLTHIADRAMERGWRRLAVLCLNFIGNHHAASGRHQASVAAYNKALEQAGKLADPALQAQVLLNLSKRAARDDTDVAINLLAQAGGQTKQVKDPGERANLELALGHSALRILIQDQARGNELAGFAHATLNAALGSFTGLGDQRGRSQALGHLGRLYEIGERRQAALDLTSRAIRAAQTGDQRDLLMDWEWQLGRLARAQGNDGAALPAYRRAVANIESIRVDIPIRYHDGRSSFRETLEPVYLGLADLLLRRAQATPEGPDRQALLREARDTMEQLKQTELEDYFRSRCTLGEEREVDLEKVGGKIAALYPILLPDRLVLLLIQPDGISQHSVPVTSARVEASARRLASQLRSRGPREAYLQTARQLHDWLIAPLERQLADQGVETLIYLPDRALRLVPPAALYNGERFLVERLQTVTAPSLRLLDPRPLPPQNMQTLLVGLSDPGPVVTRLPRPVLNSLAGAAREESRRLSRGGGRAELTRTLLRGAKGAERLSDREVDQLMGDPLVLEWIRDTLRIPGVKAEIDTLNDLLPSHAIVDREFDRTSFQENLLGDAPYGVVHIASHGVFGGSAEESFIMAYDDILDMNDLERLLRSEKFDDQPIELLTLSACQTAEGDDRSPLGISGLAIKARVRSALGSLWPVSDQGTAALMTTFYTRLSQPGTSKIEALRQAQLGLLQSEEFSHPFFWSPFILVGNWL